MKEEINWGSDLLNDIMKFLEDKEYYDNIGRSIMLPDDAELFSTRLTILINTQIRKTLSQQREEIGKENEKLLTLLQMRDGGGHDADCKANYGRQCNCGHETAKQYLRRNK